VLVVVLVEVEIVVIEVVDVDVLDVVFVEVEVVVVEVVRSFPWPAYCKPTTFGFDTTKTGEPDFK
jgi:hypothetical protein